MGDEVGIVVGAVVGPAVGNDDGAAVGAMVGVFVGCFVDRRIGLIVVLILHKDDVSKSVKVSPFTVKMFST